MKSTEVKRLSGPRDHLVELFSIFDGDYTSWRFTELVNLTVEEYRLLTLFSDEFGLTEKTNPFNQFFERSDNHDFSSLIDFRINLLLIGEKALVLDGLRPLEDLATTILKLIHLIPWSESPFPSPGEDPRPWLRRLSPDEEDEDFRISFPHLFDKPPPKAIQLSEIDPHYQAKLSEFFQNLTMPYRLALLSSVKYGSLFQPYWNESMMLRDCGESDHPLLRDCDDHCHPLLRDYDHPRDHHLQFCIRIGPAMWNLPNLRRILEVWADQPITDEMAATTNEHVTITIDVTAMEKIEILDFFESGSLDWESFLTDNCFSYKDLLDEKLPDYKAAWHTQPPSSAPTRPQSSPPIFLPLNPTEFMPVTEFDEMTMPSPIVVESDIQVDETTDLFSQYLWANIEEEHTINKLVPPYRVVNWPKFLPNLDYEYGNYLYKEFLPEYLSRYPVGNIEVNHPDLAQLVQQFSH